MKCFVGFFIIAGLLQFSCNGKKTSETAGKGNGNLIYAKYCLSCHQVNGSGVPGMYPPLINTDWVQGDKSRLIAIVLNGLKGEIVVNGQVYRTAMPAHQYLSNEQIADVLTYIRSNFGNEAAAILPSDVASIRKNSR